jgi:hypothetical protein
MRRVAPAIAARIHALLASGTPQTVIQETLGVGRSTVLRAKTGISRAKKGPGGRVRKPGPPPAFSAQQLRRPAAALARLRKRLGDECEITADDISREVAARGGSGRSGWPREGFTRHDLRGGLVAKVEGPGARRVRFPWGATSPSFAANS